MCAILQLHRGGGGEIARRGGGSMAHSSNSGGGGGVTRRGGGGTTHNYNSNGGTAGIMGSDNRVITGYNGMACTGGGVSTAGSGGRSAAGGGGIGSSNRRGGGGVLHQFVTIPIKFNQKINMFWGEFVIWLLRISHHFGLVHCLD